MTARRKVDNVPLKRRDCQHCVYVSTLDFEQQAVPICANRPETPGRIVCVRPSTACRNFRAKPAPTVRRVPPQPPNDQIRYISLTKGKFAIVDAQDYEWLSKHRWRTHEDRSGTCYALRGSARKVIFMHRAIMNPPKGMVVDHIDGNGLNNRRSNLRICSKRQNKYNQRPMKNAGSRFKGVYLAKGKSDQWCAVVRCKGEAFYLGSFDDEIEAARAYDRKAVELFGEFAYLNFPEEVTPGT